MSAMNCAHSRPGGFLCPHCNVVTIPKPFIDEESYADLERARDVALHAEMGLRERLNNAAMLLNRKVAELDGVIAERDTLREALRPFAEVLSNVGDRDNAADEDFAGAVTFGELRAAVKALEGK